MDTREFLENFLRRSQTLHTEVKRYSIRDGVPEDNAFVREKVTRLDDNGAPREEEHIELYVNKCGAILGAYGAGEVIGKCQRCTDFVPKHSATYCRKCLKLLCLSCAKVYQGAIFCRPCKIKIISKNLFFMGLKGFHFVMSQKISEKE